MASLAHLRGRTFTERTPTISLDRSARYKTQSGLADNIIGKTLTDKQIARYEASGWYEGVKRDPDVEKKKLARERKEREERVKKTKSQLRRLLGL